MRLPENCLKSFTSLPLGGCARICRLMGREQYREQRVQTLRGTRDLLFHPRRADQGRRARSHSSVPPPILRTSGGSGWPWGLGRACGPGGGGRAPWSFFWEKKRNYGGGGGPGLSARPEGPAMLRLRLSLPSNNLGAREILAALANRIILSV